MQRFYGQRQLASRKTSDDNDRDDEVLQDEARKLGNKERLQGNYSHRWTFISSSLDIGV
jgi:hypothetical protein